MIQFLIIKAGQREAESDEGEAENIEEEITELTIDEELLTEDATDQG